MNDQQPPAGSRNSRSAQDSEAITRELTSLKQASDHLSAIERDLENRRVQLQTQITRYTEQAPLARQANRHDLANEALARVAQLQPELTRVQEQLARIVARQKEITSRQLDLLRQTSAPGSVRPASSSSSPYPARRKPRKRRRILTLSAAATLLLLTALALGQTLRSTPAQQPTTTALAQASPTPTATPFISPTPTPQTYPFRPDGTGPTTQQCLIALGHPCYSPEQIQRAFNLPALYKQGYNGAGQTIVILGVGKTSSLQADLHHFDKVWGLPDPPSFKIIQQAGPPAPYTCPDKEDDLQLENTLDVEWAHAIAPGANIVLLLGSNKSPSGSREDNCLFWRMADTLNYALYNQLGQIITISYGGSELGAVGASASEKSSDRQFYLFQDAILKDAVTAGITVLASSGDNGVTNPDGSNNPNAVWRKPNVSWPASDPYVLAVGGTTLQVRDASGTYSSERVWNDSNGGATGGGLSAVFPEPDYQLGLLNQRTLKGKRGLPDVAFPAEPSFDLYASFETGVLGQVNSRKWKHWDVIGGTSASAPCWAGLIAIANQMRGKPLGFIHPALYSLRGKSMHDITSGNNTYHGITGYKAQSGYDLASGWGTPIADRFLADLIAAVDYPTIPCPVVIHKCS
ncbi:MAG TPA: S8 family serine peptidase [Ktedonobacterales bacterium]|jgi:subtilase family serine protease